MLVCFIGKNNLFKEYLKEYGMYDILEFSTDKDADFVLPEFEEHEKYEEYAAQNFENISKLFSSKEGPVWCVVTPDYDSGISLVLFEILYKKFGSFGLILFSKNFASKPHIKTLNRILFGVYYNFINVCIDKLIFFSFDIMRKFYQEINFVDLSGWYSKCAKLFHRYVVFTMEKVIGEFTGDVVWSPQEILEMEKTPKLILLLDIPITEEVLKENNFYVFYVTYFISSYSNINVDAIEKDIEKKMEVLRNYKVYEIGSGDLLEYRIVPQKI